MGAIPIGAPQDDRRAVRVFLASSHSLVEERKGFPAALARIGELNDLARSFRLVAVRWEQDAYGAAHLLINDSIQEAVDFEGLDVVVVVIWQALGEGTLHEYERALRLWRQHRKPRLLVYCRAPPADLQAEQARQLDAFRERLISEGVVPSSYGTPVELFEALEKHLPRLLRPASIDTGSPAVLRRRFLAAATLNVSLAVATAGICSYVRFPEGGVSWASVAAILAAPVLLFLTGLWTSLAYRRLLSAFRGLWHSPGWTDESLYESFRGLLPPAFLPQRVARHFPSTSGTTLALLALGLLSGVVAQYSSVFQEILLWDYCVGWDVVRRPDGTPVTDALGNVVSAHVDRRRERWPFGLQDPRVQETCERERRQERRADCVVYVHAAGRFPEEPGQEFRRNLGPEVWLPYQTWGYVGLFAGTAALGGAPLIQLFRLRGTLTRGSG